MKLFHPSPLVNRRWRRFKANKRGLVSLWIFAALFLLSLMAEVISNDKPLMVYYENALYFPLLKSYPETTFGGDFTTETDYKEPTILANLRKGNNWVIFPPNANSYDTIDLYTTQPAPAKPGTGHLLGTDDRARDVLARLIYGFRLSVLFAMALTLIGVAIGILAGAIQGYFGGRTDLWFQRFMEIWGSMPELYLLIIFASIFNPGIALLMVLLS
ncbi:MAG: ABC transporter permease, partial [Magnetococcales bacterium]|nr:ABC transporter permease [Magnetococcales bacterium]